MILPASVAIFATFLASRTDAVHPVQPGRYCLLQPISPFGFFKDSNSSRAACLKFTYTSPTKATLQYRSADEFEVILNYNEVILEGEDLTLKRRGSTEGPDLFPYINTKFFLTVPADPTVNAVYLHLPEHYHDHDGPPEEETPGSKPSAPVFGTAYYFAESDATDPEYVIDKYVDDEDKKGGVTFDDASFGTVYYNIGFSKPELEYDNELEGFFMKFSSPHLDSMKKFFGLGGEFAYDEEFDKMIYFPYFPSAEPVVLDRDLAGDDYSPHY
ncbi:hypothetical protein FOZ60_001193 [Perkinsus olseni]|uniref:Uncharacterized protein n=1 Tax=Perkinsus olseni TaxID=32597 RepID=A0A7J6P0X7_PEROL|nr:hypothetical protein FOZ60_001193 [Perkinsus olseni]